MRGLFLKVLVSVRVPLASTLVVTSELSGAGLVAFSAVAFAAFALSVALAFAASFLVQPAASAASITIINRKLVLLTLSLLLIG
jgi:hypothetical protein